MTRTRRFGATVGAVLLILSLGGCAMYQQAGETIADDVAANSRLGELVDELRAVPGVAEAEHGYDALGLPRTATVSLSFHPGAVPADWGAAATAIENASGDDVLARVRIDVSVTDALGTVVSYRVGELPAGSAPAELEALAGFSALLDVPVQVVLKPREGGYTRQVQSSEPAATRSLAGIATEWLALEPTTGSVDVPSAETVWDLPGLYAWNALDPAAMALLSELSASIPLSPATFEAADPGVLPELMLGLNLREGQVPSFHLFERTAAEPGASENWPAVVAAVRLLLDSGVPALDLGYLRFDGAGEEATSRSAGLFVGACPAILTDSEMFGFDPVAESRAFAEALARSWVDVPSGSVGHCDRYAS